MEGLGRMSSPSVSGASGGAVQQPAISGAAREIPVFVFPAQLDFYHDDETTHKKVVTVYNPYEFDVTFKLLCNNPKKYAVVEPEGRIGGLRCVDIVIRHVAVSPQAVDITDKFRIHMFEDGTTEILGKRDVLAVLHRGNPEAETASLGTRQRKALTGVLPGLGGDAVNQINNRGEIQSPNYIACFVGLLCIMALFLPTRPESSQTTYFLQDYEWLHLSVNQKLVFAYVLGLVTLAILRT